MRLYHAFDASNPPSRPYPGVHAAAGYVGGDTPHVWTLKEWNRATNDGGLRSLPIWVNTDFSKDPVDMAIQAMRAVHALGWYQLHPQAGHRIIALDTETSHDATWIRRFAHTTFNGYGYLTLDYRSLDAHLAAPSGKLEWIAHYDVPPGPYTGDQCMYQYKAEVPWDGTRVDLNVMDDKVYSLLGRGPRKATKV